MEKISCNIIQDILPLYVDDVVSDDTRKLVGNHLLHCADCQKEYEKMKQPFVMPVSANARLQDAKMIQTFQRKWSRKKAIIVVISSLLSIVIFAGLFFLLCVAGFPASSDQVSCTTEIQHSVVGYLDQEFVLHFKPSDDSSIHCTEEEVYGTDNDGNPVLVSVIIHVYDVPVPLFYGTGNYTTAYFYPGETPPDDSLDYSVIVVYGDKTVTYHMWEEGLFEVQEGPLREAYYFR